MIGRAGLAGMLLASALIAGSAPAATPAPPAVSGFQTSAATAILMDAASGAVLFEHEADAAVPPASTAKLMTAELVFERLADGRLTRDALLPVSENAWRRGGAPSGGSTMFAKVKSQVSVGDLLRGLAVVSGNDACIALAEGISGTEAGFADAMTARGRDLGLTRSTFTDSWGSDNPGQRTTARDMAVLARHLVQTFPELYGLFGEREFTWNGIRQTNRNPLLALNIGADGLKTGESREGGYGLVGSALQDGERLIVVVGGLKSAKERASEAARLLAWGFRSFERKTLFQAGEVIGQARVFGGDSATVPLAAAEPVSLLAPRDGTEPLSGRIVYEGPLPAPLDSGIPAGRLKLYRGGSEVLDVPLRTAQKVATGSLARRAMDAGLELLAGLMRRDVHP